MLLRSLHYLSTLALLLVTSSSASRSACLADDAKAVSSHAERPLEVNPKLRAPVHELQLEQATAPLRRQDIKLQSAASCAATACHGALGSGALQKSEYETGQYDQWLSLDPHARSWRTMCSDKSVAILTRLRILNSAEIVDQAAFDNCLACHNTTRRFDEPRSAEFHAEGVGCASCHGPSENWRAEHFQPDFVAVQSTSQATLLGFVAAQDLLTRARMCAACHIGDRDRDMNHDIIAAGHPALHYEFTGYHLRQPKHWRDGQAADQPRYEASLWLAGQIAGLDASLSLLESRAGHALPMSTWPELASHDCSSCHQNLRLGNEDYQSTTRPKSSARYSAWHRFGLEQLLRYRHSTGVSDEHDAALFASLTKLTAVMEASSLPVPKDAIEAARRARIELDKWLCSSAGNSEIATFNADRLRAVAAFAGQSPQTFASWESTSQFYFAAVAAREAWPGGRRGPALDAAMQLRSKLTFEPGTSSPSLSAETIRRAVLSSSGWYSAAQLQTETLRKLDDIKTDPQLMPDKARLFPPAPTPPEALP